jgi:hypothetical protein
VVWFVGGAMNIAIFKYIERIGIAVSVLLNVILGGSSNQTFSARNYGWKLSGKPNLVWLIDFLFLWKEKYHCELSWTYWAYKLKRYNAVAKDDIVRMDDTYYES